MKRETWRKLWRRFLTRLVMPLAVAFLLMFFLLVLKMLAGTPTAAPKPRDPAIERRHQPPVQPEFDRSLTKSGPPAKKSTMSVETSARWNPAQKSGAPPTPSESRPSGQRLARAGRACGG
jgi:hypothetical protein